MSRKKKLATILLMLAGMILGVIILLTVPAKQHPLELNHLLKDSIPSFNAKGKRESVMDLIDLFKAKRRIEQLAGKDSLTHSDSLEIRHIDQQLNHMLHD